jgi:hypothetical protein
LENGSGVLDKEVEIEEKKSSDCLFGDALFENLKD